MKLIAITGGIGTGKSVVSSILKVMGYPVYDCDSEAKRLMVTDAALVQGLKQLLGDEAYNADGSLNRAYMSSRIFGHDEMVAQVNALVHPAVLADIQRWAQHTGSELNFVETALLQESGMARILDDVWTVTAPTGLRISRVAKRSGLTEQQTRDRMGNQSFDAVDDSSHAIVNDNNHAVIPQVMALLAEL